MSGWLTGSQALAHGAADAGVALVCGYPGAPVTAVVNSLVALTTEAATRIEWTSNEKVALEMAFGASVGGIRSLVCIKSVGLNIALDPLMVINLAGVNAGLVLLVGDDPGGWGSQNEQDSRSLGVTAEIPVLEPTSVADAYQVILEAFALSEAVGVPVMVRFTRALALARQRLVPGESGRLAPAPTYRHEFMRWVVLPINVVERHAELHDRIRRTGESDAIASFSRAEGAGRGGIIAAGFTYRKLMDLLGDHIPPGLRVLRLGTINPFPSELVKDFARDTEALVVLEETAPLVEQATRAACQVNGGSVPIYGRLSGHVPTAGELFGPDIAAALVAVWPGLDVQVGGETSRPRPSREPLCEDCPYHVVLTGLCQAMIAEGGRDAFIVVGEPGCMVRAQLPPYRLMDVKTSLGSSVAMASGLALGESTRRVVALCGDSAFIHSGFNGLLDAVRSGAAMTLLILDNGTTALSGGQPHPGSPRDARGTARRSLDLQALASAAGPASVELIDLDDGGQIYGAIEAALGGDGVRVIIARGRCPVWVGPDGESPDG